jgi:hypothetical protein
VYDALKDAQDRATLELQPEPVLQLDLDEQGQLLITSVLCANRQRFTRVLCYAY